MCVCVCVCVCWGGDPQLTVLVIRTQKFWSELVRKQAAGLPKRLGRREPDRTGSSSATWRKYYISFELKTLASVPIIGNGYPFATI